MKTTTHIRRAKRESHLFRIISSLFSQQAVEDPRLRDIFINRVELNADGSICYVFFYTALGKNYFDDVLGHLILYKPSLRAAVAHELSGRYTPDIAFRFDEKFEKQQEMERLIDRVSNNKHSGE